MRYSVKGAVALAIGDGANDVPMIQAADVGVGISGQEGMQAANSADFALAQFRYLRELLLVQGRNMYRRQTTMVLYVFYKSIMMVLTTFWFAFFSAMTGQKMNLEIGVQAFNVVWTGVPIYFITLFDRDVSDETSRCMPQVMIPPPSASSSSSSSAGDDSRPTHQPTRPLRSPRLLPSPFAARCRSCTTSASAAPTRAGGPSSDGSSRRCTSRPSSRSSACTRCRATRTAGRTPASGGLARTR